MSEAGQFGSSFGTQFATDKDSSVKDLITQILQVTSNNENEEFQRTMLLNMINNRYLQVLKGRHWKFLNRETVIDFHAPYSNGYLTIDQGTYLASETIADPELIPAAQFDATHNGQKIHLKSASSGSTYRVKEVINNKTLQFSNKLSSENVVDSTFEILHDRYDLEESVAKIKSMFIGHNTEMIPVGLQEFRRLQEGVGNMKGQPQYYTTHTHDVDSGQWTIEVFPAPDKRYSVYIDYDVRPIALRDEENCHLLIPREHMDVIYYGALADFYRNLNDTANFTTALNDFKKSYLTLISDYDMTDSRAKMINKRNYYGNSRRRRRRYRGLQHFSRYDD